jgi:hypothetical protein
VSGRRQVSPGAVDATCTAVALASIEQWLRRAPEPVIASLAAPAYREPAPRALSRARELASDLRYYSAVLSCAIRASDDEPRDDEGNPF